MPYITTAERIGRQEGRKEGQEAVQEGILDVLEARFGKVSAELATRIRAISEFARLRALLKEAVIAPDLQKFVDSLPH